MALDVLSNDILTHEQQLGEQLNESVHMARRSDFSLLLAMLTDDVRAHSQFKLPRTESPEITTSSAQLRKEFQLPAEAPLAMADINELSAFNQANLVENNQFEQLHLTNALKPKPLAFRDDASHIANNVLENTSLYCQQQHRQSKVSSQQLSNQRADFNAKAWLAAVQTAIVKSPLMVTQA